METSKKILIIIPAYNEERSVGRVVEEVKRLLPHADVLVVDDGSIDHTSDRAKIAGAIVLELPFNLGIGGAMQAGYKYAYERGYDVAIQVDGDGQHNPNEISGLLQTLEAKQVDMAIGSRFVNGSAEYKSSVMRSVGIVFFSKVVSMVVGQKITDPTSGFRAGNRKVIGLFASSYPQDYPEPEALVFLSKRGLKVAEIPAVMNQRFAGESSITKIRSVYYVVKVLLAIFVDCFKKKP